ncbi:TetR/AcrR family transcriptional regulator [Pseudonocardia xinjiangensis]|uniref:TetR/AcrR family transcriptional regulator n=1 Tax=Pseudonocardia xinjiangensis TaxID=75289 RepID=UPI003D8E10CF
MPKKVDHQAQRALIADALMRVAATRGLEAVSLRHVATEAGVSTGMVQHYFRTKDQMMIFALDMVSAGVQARLAAETGDQDVAPTPRDLVRGLLLQMLPLDEQRATEGKVALAFLSYAAVRPHVAAELRENTAQMRAFFADQIRATSPAERGVDPELAATALLALVDGLGVHVLGGHYSPDAALAALDQYLDSVLPAEATGPRPRADRTITPPAPRTVGP